MLEQLQKINEALKNLNKVFAEFEEGIEYRRSHSNCCDALLVNDTCMDCKRHAGPQDDE